MARIFIIFFVALVGGITVGCRPQLYMPSSTDPAMQNDLLRGRKLYVNHCSSCHNLHLPTDYGVQQWKKNVDEMQERSKINNNEKQLILQYLTYQR